jgi:2-dehydro-3-deoxygluconokinase
MTAHVLTLGETMGMAVAPAGQPFRVATSARFDIGGAEATVAIGLSRLGVPSTWLGLVGRDGVGERILRDLRAEGVDVSGVRFVDAPTGFMLRELRGPGYIAVTYHRNGTAGSMITPADVEAAFERRRPTLVHLTGITPALSEDAAAAVRRAVALAEEVGAEVSLDVNLRRTLPGFQRAVETIQDLLPRVDVLFVGDDELDAVTSAPPDAAAAALADRGIGEVVVKLGSAGAEGVIGGSRVRVPARSVDVVDVIGAGDSFVAGYLAARVEGLGLAERLGWGTITAAHTVASPSDWHGLPTREDLLAFEEGPHTRR